MRVIKQDINNKVINYLLIIIVIIIIMVVLGFNDPYYFAVFFVSVYMCMCL